MGQIANQAALDLLYKAKEKMKARQERKKEAKRAKDKNKEQKRRKQKSGIEKTAAENAAV